jgi:hypothetical protein
MRAMGEKMFAYEREHGQEALVQLLLDTTTDVVDSAEDTEAVGSAAMSARVAKEWAESAFSTIRVDERLAASFMATRLPQSDLPEIKAPWRTMLIELPKNMLREHDATPANGWASPEFIDWVFVQNIPSQDPGHVELGLQSTHANWLIWLVPSCIGPKPPMPVRTLSEMAWLSEHAEARPFDIMGRPRETDPNGRDIDADVDAIITTNRMVLRFVAGTLFELASQESAVQSVKRFGPPKRRRTQDEPSSWVFRLTRDVRVDCRTAIREASARGEGRAPTIQSLVRGHWKPRLSERIGRPVHVEPYWRGPEDAPIAVRSHVLKGDAS